MLVVRRNNSSNWLNDWLDNTLFNTEATSQVRTTAPAINVKETCEEYIMEVAVPGLKKEWVRINLTTKVCSTWPLRTRWSTRRKKKNVVAEETDTSAICVMNSHTATMNRATLFLTTWSATISQQALPMAYLPS